LFQAYVWLLVKMRCGHRPQYEYYDNDDESKSRLQTFPLDKLLFPT